MATTGPSYPVSLVLAGRAVVVVGGGRIALRKVQGLLAVGALVHVIAPDVCDELATLDGVTIERRAFRPGDVAGCWLAVEATGDAAVAAAVAADGEEHRVWVNAADQPTACRVTLPAVVRRGPVTVAFSTAGASPALAAWMRARAEDTYGPEYGVLAELLAETRAEHQRRGGSTEALDWRRVLDSGILEEIRSGRLVEAKERLQAWLSSSSE
jgi:siroheme synthase-like protein